MGEMDEVGALRTYDFRRLDGFLNVEMSRMRPAEPQRIKYQNAHTLRVFNAAGGSSFASVT